RDKRTDHPTAIRTWWDQKDVPRSRASSDVSWFDSKKNWVRLQVREIVGCSATSRASRTRARLLCSPVPFARSDRAKVERHRKTDSRPNNTRARRGPRRGWQDRERLRKRERRNRHIRRGRWS